MVVTMMKNNSTAYHKHLILISVFLFIFLIPAIGHATVAGKVIFSIGKAQLKAVDGTTKRVKRGISVNDGDTIVTSKRGQVQIRMVDNALISVRPASELVIEKYVYKKDPATDKSYTKLVKGGFRSLSGKIGKRNKSNYKVTTVVGTIGIRGTDYTVMLCNSDCGSRGGGSGGTDTGVKNGLYVGVLSGGIALKNETGESSLGSQQYAHVASVNSAPKRLPAPPSFLMFDRTVSDKSERNKSKKSKSGQKKTKKSEKDKKEKQGKDKSDKKDEKKDKKDKADGKEEKKEGKEGKEEKEEKKDEEKKSKASEDESKDSDSKDEKKSDEEGAEEEKSSSEDEEQSADEGKKDSDTEKESVDSESTDSEESASEETNSEESSSEETTSEDSESGADGEESASEESPSEENSGTDSESETSSEGETVSDSTEESTDTQSDTGGDSTGDSEGSETASLDDLAGDREETIASEPDEGLLPIPTETVDNGTPLPDEPAPEEEPAPAPEPTPTPEPPPTYTPPVIVPPVEVTSPRTLIVSSTGSHIFSNNLVVQNNEVLVNDFISDSQSLSITNQVKVDGVVSAVYTIDQGTSVTNNFGEDSVTGLSWGRWSEGELTQTINGIDELSPQADALNNDSVHWIVGQQNQEALVMPITGSANYNLIGNTDPTDNFGNIGVLGSANLAVDFMTSEVTTNIELGINNQVWRVEDDISTLNANGSFSSDALSVTVTDGSNGQVINGSGQMDGQLIQPVETNTGIPGGAALGYQLEASPNQTNTHVSGVAAFEKKP